MRTLLTTCAAIFLTSGSCLAEDPTLGHVTLPKGKYVLTNVDNRTTMVINVDEHGIVRGSKQAAPAAATPAAGTGATATTTAATTAAASTPAATTADAKSASSIIKDKIKKEAERAIKRGDVQKLIKKVGID